MRAYLSCGLFLSLLLLATSAQGDVVEKFTTAVATSDLSTLGVCKQLTVRVFGTGGAVTVAGNGAAVIKSSAPTDAAFLASTNALPASTYKVTARISKINFPQNPPGGAENGVTLLAISNAQPLPASEMWWASYRMLAIEVDAVPDTANAHPIYLNYWDASNLYTWNGTKWGVGDPNWVPVLTYDPALTYEVEIEKAANWYYLRVRSATGAVLTQASVPVPNVRPASTEYALIGDRLTSDFNGTMEVSSVSLPTPTGCNPGGDGGTAGDAKVGDAKATDAKVTKDAGPGDAKPGEKGKLEGGTGADKGAAGDKGTTADSGASADKGAGVDKGATADRGKTERATSWDLSTPDQGGATPPASSGCNCRLDDAPGAASAPALGLGVLLLGLTLLARRRRWAA